MAFKIQKGDRLPYTNSSGVDIASGDPVLVGATFGVAVADIADGESGTLDLKGVYEVRKAAGEAISLGGNLYWDADGDPQGAVSGTGCLTATSTDNVYAGKAFAAAGTTATVVQINLNA
ncbi:MAG: DUF2190 family protein [Humidesulfovibrio sp.]